MNTPPKTETINLSYAAVCFAIAFAMFGTMGPSLGFALVGYTILWAGIKMKDF